MTACLAGVACGRDPVERPLVYTAAPARAARPIYPFAVHPLHNPQKLAEAYQPLIDLLNRRLPNARMELVASRDYPAYNQRIRERGPVMLLANPWQALEAIKVGYGVIAMAGDAEDFKGIFVTRKDSPIRNVLDLKGQVVSYPAATALAACIMPQDFLHRHGLDVNRDITNVYVGSQESSILQAYLGKAAVAATWPPPWRMFQKDHPREASELRVLWETPHLLNNAVLLRDDVPEELRDTVRQTLLELPNSAEGQAILRGMSTARFYPANDASYAPVRSYIADFERDIRKVEGP